MPQKNLKCKKILYLGLDPSRWIHDGKLTHLPVIKIVPRALTGNVKQAFLNLKLYSHVLFTSRTAVDLYYQYGLKLGFSCADLQNQNYICVGKATAQCVADFGFKNSCTAQTETAEGVIALLKTLFPIHHLFFPRSSKGRALIPNFLKEKKCHFTLLDLYDTLPCQVCLPDLNDFDEIIFTSPSTVHAFFALTQVPPPLSKCKALGPITERALKHYLLKLKGF